MHYRTCVSTLPNMHIPITKNAFPHYQIRIFVPHFVCIFLYAGAINRPLRLLTAANYVANTPSGVGVDSSCPYPNITNYRYSHYRIRVYSLSNMHIHIINYVFSSHHAHIFALPYQYIRFLLSIILNIKQPNIAYIYT